jgi:hypothetical protein
LKVSLMASLIAVLVVSGCSVREDRLLNDTDYSTLLSACRNAMASLPHPGPAVDPTIYRIDPGDSRFRQQFAVLESRTVTFAAPPEQPSVTDARLPPEILRLEPLYVAVTPDAVHISLCGSGLLCSANATRAGAGLEVLVYLKGGQPNCQALADGLWYCHE